MIILSLAHAQASGNGELINQYVRMWSLLYCGIKDETAPLV